MPDYAAMQAELPKLKAALTRAKKAGPLKVLEAVEHAFNRFDAIGYPDAWHTWKMAAFDARGAYARNADRPDPALLRRFDAIDAR
jgi:hypothetical protein